MLQVYLVRHSETQWNAGDVFKASPTVLSLRVCSKRGRWQNVQTLGVPCHHQRSRSHAADWRAWLMPVVVMCCLNRACAGAGYGVLEKRHIDTLTNWKRAGATYAG